MPYDQVLAERVRDQLARRNGIEAKAMFGGLGFLLHGNMLVGIWRDSLIVRVGPDGYEDALREPHVRAFDITGRAMTGWVMVGSAGVARDELLSQWVQRALSFVSTLGVKPPRSGARRRAKRQGPPRPARF